MNPNPGFDRFSEGDGIYLHHQAGGVAFWRRGRRDHRRRAVGRLGRRDKIELPKTAPPPDADAIRAPINHDAYVTVTSAKELDAWVARARAQHLVCVDTETTSLDPMQAGLCGVSLALKPGEACYIPCGHRKGDGTELDLSAKDGDDASSR